MITVAQIGARMHYAVPIILDKVGNLDHLFTDICAVKGWPQYMQRIPFWMRHSLLERLIMRTPKGVDSSRITAFTGFGLNYAIRLALAHNQQERDKQYLWAGSEFGRLISENGIGETRAVYGFNTASRELFDHASQRGVRKILEQTITPRTIEQRLMNEEAEAYPLWANSKQSCFGDELGQREEDEWDAADVILCASEFVREGIIQCGGQAEKCRVVPYGIDHRRKPIERTARAPGPLRVLTVGSVGLRKGSHYVLEVSKLLKGQAVFRIVGPHHCSGVAVRELQEHLDAPGSVPRSAVSNHYDWADVYLLPSLCEGSATSTYEAMFNGLPVICTPNTGSMVRDGVDGFIVPARSPSAIVEKIEFLIKHPHEVILMSKSALDRAAMFSLEAYSNKLVGTLTDLGFM